MRGVSVVGGFNGWDPEAHISSAPRLSSGIWEGFVPGSARERSTNFTSNRSATGTSCDKADPLGLLHEKPPRTASVVWDLDYQWSDQDWMQKRGERNSLRAPHVGL